MRIIARVIKTGQGEITIVTNINETVEQCLNRRKIDWQAYLVVDKFNQGPN